jgi:endonuclease/exonuclease/phosphatase (EEP) superfamily protein YafD
MRIIRSSTNFFVNLVLAAWTAYAMLVILLLILRFTIGERPLIPGFGSPVGTFNSMLQIALFPAIPGLLVFLLLRRPRLAAWQIPAVAMLIVLYGGNFVPHLPVVTAADTDTSHLKLMTYNLLYSNTSYDRVVEVIKAADPDVVALQEFTDEASAYLSKEFREIYPYQALHPSGAPTLGATTGAGILSRYPIIEDEITFDIHNQCIHRFHSVMGQMRNYAVRCCIIF